MAPPPSCDGTTPPELDLRDVPAVPLSEFEFAPLPQAMVRVILIDILAEGVATSLLNASAGLRKVDWILWATDVVDRLFAADLIPDAGYEDVLR